METNSSKPVKKLDKKEIVKAFWRWTFFSHSNYNYERLPATGMVNRAAIKRHMAFFNTEPHFGGVIHGMVIAMEEQRANGAPISDETINGMKTGLMGPFAGIGDTLWQGTLTPIVLSFGISLASTGNLLGPVLYTLIMFGVMLPIAYTLWMKGYEVGREGIQKILEGDLLRKVMTGASTMGGIVLGALTAGFVKLSTPLVLTLGGSNLSVQQNILDKLLVNILPLAITLITLKLLNKKLKSTTVLLILIVIGAIGGMTYLF